MENKKYENVSKEIITGLEKNKKLYSDSYYIDFSSRIKKMKEKSFKMPLTSVYFFTIFLPLTIYMPFGRRFMLLDSRRPSNENTPCCAVFVLVSSVVSMP